MGGFEIAAPEFEIAPPTPKLRPEDQAQIDKAVRSVPLSKPDYMQTEHPLTDWFSGNEPTPVSPEAKEDQANLEQFRKEQRATRQRPSPGELARGLASTAAEAFTAPSGGAVSTEPGEGASVNRHLTQVSTPGQRVTGALGLASDVAQAPAPVMGPAALEAGGSLLSALKLGAGVGAGMGASYGVGKVAPKVGANEEQTQLAQDLAFWMPSIAASLSGLRVSGADLPEVKGGTVGIKGAKAGVAVTPEAVNIGGRVGPFRGSVSIPRNGAQAQPALEPPTIEGSQVDPSSQMLADHEVIQQRAARVANGQPPVEPPPAPPGPPKVTEITQDDIQHVAALISKLPAELRAQGLLEAHQTMARILESNGKVVGPDGKLVIIDSPKAAEKAAADMVNDEVDRQDKAVQESAKAKPAVTETKAEAPAKRPTRQQLQQVESKAFEVSAPEPKFEVAAPEKAEVESAGDLAPSIVVKPSTGELRGTGEENRDAQRVNDNIKKTNVSQGNPVLSESVESGASSSPAGTAGNASAKPEGHGQPSGTVSFQKGQQVRFSRDFPVRKGQNQEVSETIPQGTSAFIEHAGAHDSGSGFLRLRLADGRKISVNQRMVEAHTQNENGPVSFRGSMWEHKGGQFFKDGKVLDKSDDIADALAALSQKDYFGGKTIEGEVAGKSIAKSGALEGEMQSPRAQLEAVKEELRGQYPHTPEDKLEQMAREQLHHEQTHPPFLGKERQIGEPTAKPRTNGQPLEHGFDFRPAEDVGQKARDSVQKQEGALPRGERRKIERTPEEHQTQELFGKARKELGEDATSDQVMARVKELKQPMSRDEVDAATGKTVDELRKDTDAAESKLRGGTTVSSPEGQTLLKQQRANTRTIAEQFATEHGKEPWAQKMAADLEAGAYIDSQGNYRYGRDGPGGTTGSPEGGKKIADWNKQAKKLFRNSDEAFDFGRVVREQSEPTALKVETITTTPQEIQSRLSESGWNSLNKTERAAMLMLRGYTSADWKPLREKSWDELDEATKEELAQPLASKGSTAQPETAEVPGPGAKNVSTGKETKTSHLSDLTDAVSKTASTKATVAERMRVGSRIAESTSEAKDSLTHAYDRVKGAMAAAWDILRRPPEWDDFTALTGRWSGARQEANWELQKFSDAIKHSIPDKLKREAITNWIEADGDEATLRARAQGAKAPYKAAYEAALKLSDEEQTVARNIMNFHDAILEEAQKAGIVDEGVENYIQHIWDKTPEAARKVMAQINFAALRPNPAFAKQRKLPTYYEGEQLGFKPVNKDVGFLTTAHDRAFQDAIASRAYIKSLFDGKGKDGRPLATISRASAQEVGDETSAAYLIKPHVRPAEEYADYRMVDHPALRKWRWADNTEDGKQTFVQGDALIHPEIYQRVKNNLGTSAMRTWTVSIAGHEVHPGKAIMGVSWEAKRWILAFGGLFHQTTLGVHAVEHKVSPIFQEELNLNDPVQKGLVDHGLMVSDFNAMEAFGEGLGGGGGLVSKIPVLGPLQDAYQNYLFKSYMPRLKMAMAKAALERNRARYSDKLSDDQIQLMTANQANAAFGGLNLKMLGRNPTLQDVLRTVALAPDFLEARARFVGQGAKGYGREQLTAFLLGGLVLYTIARVLNEMLDKKPHWDKPFSLVYGDKEYSLRTVQGDVWHAVTDVRGFLYSRLNPFARTGIELATGRDEQGRQRDLKAQLKDYAKENLPIPAQSFAKPSTDSNKERFMDALLRMTGINSKTFHTHAEEEAAKIARSKGSATHTAEDDARYWARRKAIEGIRKGDDTALEDARAKHLITSAEARELHKRSRKSELEDKVRNFTEAEVRQVYEKSLSDDDPEETEKLARLLRHKRRERLMRHLERFDSNESELTNQ